MASGHAYRANRPNTWLHRPMLQSEDSPCQPGAVHTWPLTDISKRSADVGFRGIAGIGRATSHTCRLSVLCHKTDIEVPFRRPWSVSSVAIITANDRFEDFRQQ